MSAHRRANRLTQKREARPAEVISVSVQAVCEHQHNLYLLMKHLSYPLCDSRHKKNVQHVSKFPQNHREKAQHLKALLNVRLINMARTH